jgi:hypothetical protein
MANFPIYRQVKGSPLTFVEMDGNLEWLSRTMSASVVTITGSTSLLGNLIVSDGITGSLFGTSSWAVSASNAVNAISASYVSGSAAIVTNLTSSNDARINGLTVGRGNSVANFSNVAIGTSANSLLDGAASTNTSIGYTSGQSNIASSANTFLGWSAGNATTGGNNTFIGSGAGRLITSGIGNIIIGRYTGVGSITNNYNTIVGHINGSLTNVSNNIILSDGQGNIKYRWDGTQNTISGGLNVTEGSITGSNALFTGTITAQTLVVQTITSSIIYSSGSNIFGNEITNIQTLTGSVNITGSLNVIGNASASSFVKSGGTSTQFLKADGTVDTNTYITAASVGNGTLSLGVSGVGLSGTQTFTANQAGNSTFTVTSNATSANTVNTIVSRDGSGNFNAGTMFGTASQATALENTGSAGFVSNMSDTYTGTAKIRDIVSLTAAEYAAIVSPSTSTLYIII